MKPFLKSFIRDAVIIVMVTLGFGILYASQRGSKKEQPQHVCPKGPIKPGDSCKIVK